MLLYSLHFLFVTLELIISCNLLIFSVVVGLKLHYLDVQCCLKFAVGPLGIGQQAIVEKLVTDHGDRFASPTPDTSRRKKPWERDGVDYNFIGRNAIHSGILGNLYVEAGTHNGVWYGTRMKVIEDTVQLGKVATFALYPEALQALMTPDLKPYVVFLKPRHVRNFSPYPSNRRESGDGQKQESEESAMVEDAKRIEASYAHYFDLTVVVEDIQRAAEELIQVADRLQNERQWIYADWVR